MSDPRPVAGFLVRVYLHLLASLAVLIAFEVWLFQSGLADSIARSLLSVPWLLVLGAFMVVGWLARRMAYRLESLPLQYAALALYVLANGLILVPLLARAEQVAPGAIASAAQLSLAGFVGLTWVAIASRRDFSGLAPYLRWGGVVAILLIVAAFVFGWHLGTWFNVAMVGLAGASVLHDTSGMLRRRQGNDRHVAAALSLFGSIAMMFWHLLRQLSRDGRGMR